MPPELAQETKKVVPEMNQEPKKTLRGDLIIKKRENFGLCPKQGGGRKKNK